MKNSVLLLSAAFALNNLIYSQEITKTDLQIPSTPGMNIIGIQNSEITKPGNYAGLFANLISPIVSNNGTIPTDLSLEFSPYYLESRDVTFKELNRTDIFRDLRISIASTSIVNADSSIFSRMGIGFRTNLLSGDIAVLSKNETTLAVANDIETTINKINSGFYGDMDTADINKLVDHITNNDVKRRVKKAINADQSDIEEIINRLNSHRVEVEQLINVDSSRWDYSLRTGHFLEFAGAFAVDFPENTIGSSQISRWGIWLNYTYKPKTKLSSIDFGAILRMSNYSFDPTVVFENQALFGDIGVSINWKIPNVKFIISGEIIGKYGISDLKTSDENNQFTFASVTESKWNISIGYQITTNSLWNISFSNINGNRNYLNNNSTQFLMGLSTALVPMQK